MSSPWCRRILDRVIAECSASDRQARSCHHCRSSTCIRAFPALVEGLRIHVPVVEVIKGIYCTDRSAVKGDSQSNECFDVKSLQRSTSDLNPKCDQKQGLPSSLYYSRTTPWAPYRVPLRFAVSAARGACCRQ